MSKIDDLIAKLCPEGVEFRELGEVLGKVDGSNRKIVKSAIKDEGKYPVYTQGANQKPDGYSDDSNNTVCDTPLILYGDHTNSLKWIDHAFIAGADGVKMIKSDAKHNIDDKFLFHCLREQINLIPNDYARHFSKLRNLKIPIPPLEVQREIVDILDKFTQLEAELEAELEARKKQYEHYRNQLLNFDDTDGVRWATMGEIGEFYGGLTGKSKTDFSDGNARFISYTNIFNNISINLNSPETVKVGTGERQRAVRYGDVLFTGSSETPDEAGMSSVVAEEPSEPTYLNSFSFIYRLRGEFANDLTPEFTKFLFRSHQMRREISKTASGVTRFNISKKSMAKIKIPIPPLAEQNRIVAILDKFDALTTDISTGLPAEITARRQQYEYYRNKLLTFEEKKEVASV